jgi:hypothetical protein
MVPTSDVGLLLIRVGARLVNESGRCSFFCEAGEDVRMPRVKEGIMCGLWQKMPKRPVGFCAEFG